MPKDLLQTPEAEMLAAEADEKVYNVIQLIYRSRITMRCARSATGKYCNGPMARTASSPSISGATAANRNFTQHCLKET